VTLILQESVQTEVSGSGEEYAEVGLFEGVFCLELGFSDEGLLSLVHTEDLINLPSGDLNELCKLDDSCFRI
jgi:hypothetical protein